MHREAGRSHGNGPWCWGQVANPIGAPEACRSIASQSIPGAQVHEGMWQVVEMSFLFFHSPATVSYPPSLVYPELVPRETLHI